MQSSRCYVKLRHVWVYLRPNTSTFVWEYTIKKPSYHHVQGQSQRECIFALELKKTTTQGWIQKELRLGTEGPDVADPTRVTAGESDESDEDDEHSGIDDLNLGGLEAGDYSDIME
jgi:hypothetical protein